MFVSTPSTTHSASARRARPIAASRSGPQTISLASSGSNSTPTTLPSATPASTRTPGPRRLAIDEDAPRARQELHRVLGIEAQLDRVAARAQRPVAPRLRQSGALRHLELRAHEVAAERLLGDRMLDLQARVHLQKVEGAATRPRRNSTVPAPT